MYKAMYKATEIDNYDCQNVATDKIIMKLQWQPCIAGITSVLHTVHGPVTSCHMCLYIDACIAYVQNTVHATVKKKKQEKNNLKKQQINVMDHFSCSLASSKAHLPCTFCHGLGLHRLCVSSFPGLPTVKLICNHMYTAQSFNSIVHEYLPESSQ